MRSVSGFVSMVSLGAIAGAVVVTLASGPMGKVFLGEATASMVRIDYASFVLGIVTGVLIGGMAQMQWAEVPRRLATWLIQNRVNFMYFAVAIVLVGALLQS